MQITDFYELARQSGATSEKGGRAVDQFCFTASELAQFVEKLTGQIEAESALVSNAQGDASDCICKGNWRQIVEKTHHLIDQYFVQEGTGDIYTFEGVLHGSHDYYYVMHRKGQLVLLSCVGSLENSNFKPLVCQGSD